MSPNDDSPSRQSGSRQTIAKVAALAAASLLMPKQSFAIGPVQDILDLTQFRLTTESAETTSQHFPPQLILKPSNATLPIELGHRSHSSHSSHRSHSSHYSGSGGGGTPTPPPPPPSNPSPPSPPPEAPKNPPQPPAAQQVIYVVTMNDARVLKGKVRSDDQHYVVTMKEIVIRVAKADVATIEKSAEPKEDPKEKPPAEIPKEFAPNTTYIVKMNDERIFKGTLHHDADHLIVVMKEGAIRIAKSDVVGIEKTPEEKPPAEKSE